MLYLFSMVLMTTLMRPLTRIPWSAPAKQRRATAHTRYIFLEPPVPARVLRTTGTEPREGSRL